MLNIYELDSPLEEQLYKETEESLREWFEKRDREKATQDKPKHNYNYLIHFMDI